jgi:hypothetical protein
VGDGGVCHCAKSRRRLPPEIGASAYNFSRKI